MEEHVSDAHLCRSASWGESNDSALLQHKEGTHPHGGLLQAILHSMQYLLAQSDSSRRVVISQIQRIQHLCCYSLCLQAHKRKLLNNRGVHGRFMER